MENKAFNRQRFLKWLEKNANFLTKKGYKELESPRKVSFDIANKRKA